MKKRHLAVALAMGLLFVGACSDDDEGDDTSSGSGSETTETTETGGGEGEEAAGDGDFCSAYTELLAGDPTPDAMREVATIAPDAAAETLEEIASGFDEDPEGFFETEEFNDLFAELNTAAAEECADSQLEVTAVDYAFEGMPSEVEAGTVGVTFVNEGAELHEMVVFRKADGETRSFDELLTLEDDAEIEAATDEAGVAFAFPGASSGGLFELSEPGEYIAVCFIPVGSTPDAGEEGGSGPPHFTEGMRVEFTVS